MIVSPKAKSLGIVTLALTPLLFLARHPASSFSSGPRQEAGHASPTRTVTTRHPALGSIAHLPLYFEPNLGQADPKADFIAHGSGYNLCLTPTEAVFAWNKAGNGNARRSFPFPQSGAMSPPATPAILRLQLLGANARSQPAGRETLPGIVNYLVGNDPKQWHAHIATYGKVYYPNVYQGIDLLYYGRDHRLEYDFVVSPHADLQAIRLNFDGSRAVRLDTNGDLIIQMADGEVRWQKPAAYQQTGGTRHAIASRYVLGGKGQVGFAVARYDAAKPLVIDPSLAYSTYLGGSGTEVGNGIAVYTGSDSHTYACMTGTTNSSRLALSGGSQDHLDPSGNPTNDAYVAKFDMSGTGGPVLKYVTYLGGSGSDAGKAIAADALGRAYVTGYTFPYLDPNTGQWVNNFPASNAMNGGMSPNTQYEDAFVAVLNNDGSLAFCKYLGGSRADEGASIAVDSNYSIYVTGYTDSFPNLTYGGYPGSGGPGGGGGGINHIPFPTTSDAYQSSLADSPYSDQNPNTDVFVTRYDSSGSSWAMGYSTLIGGNGVDQATSIAVDTTGKAYITGWSGSSFQGTQGAYRTSRTAGLSAFAAKIDTKLNRAITGGSPLVYWTFLSGNEETKGTGIAIDSSGCAYITGYDKGGYPTTPGAFQTAFNSGDTSSGNEDAFVTKLNTDASALAYSTYLGGSGIEQGSGIAVDSAGEAYVTGYTTSLSPPSYGHYAFPLKNALQTTEAGGEDVFCTKLNASGSALVFSTYLGGSSDDAGGGVAIDSAGNAYLTGSTSSSNFPVTSGAYQSIYQGGSYDAFFTRINLP